jgi:tRNA A37 threonylcarbamoyladenosine biosynthesis protein TsaE
VLLRLTAAIQNCCATSHSRGTLDAIAFWKGFLEENIMDKTLVIVNGSLGVGKTTISEQ